MAAHARRASLPRPVLIAGCGFLLGIAAALVLSLGGGASKGAPFAPIAEAAERAVNSPGARFAGAGHASTQGLEMTMVFSGEYNGETERSSMRMEAEVPAMPAAAAQLNPMVAVQDGLTVYMSMPALATGLLDGKSWMKLDFSELAEAPASSTDARAILGQLRAVGDARRVGSERVRGVPTTRYAAMLDPELHAEQLREAGDDLGADLIESQDGPSAVDVWVDDEQLVRRTAMTVPFDLVGGEGSEMTMTMDFFDFGVEPQIELPPEGDVYDATELSRGLLESALESS